LKEKENLDTKRKASYNLDEIKVRWKKAALENCPGVPCVVTPPAPSFTCGTSTVTDVDGNVYNTKLIGSSQCWMTSNLKVTKYNNGDEIPDSTNSTWGTATIGARTEYVASGVTGYVDTFGYLYIGYAVVDTRKLCPDGWHVPTDAEWTTLTTELGGQSVAGGKMKSVGTAYWNSPNTGATNESGFSALPGGIRRNDGSSLYISDFAFFWTAELGTGVRLLRASDGSVSITAQGVGATGASVRCLKD
jgi:uncharacterized protein (TIGR02145 family)